MFVVVFVFGVGAKKTTSRARAREGVRLYIIVRGMTTVEGAAEDDKPPRAREGNAARSRFS